MDFDVVGLLGFVVVLGCEWFVFYWDFLYKGFYIVVKEFFLIVLVIELLGNSIRDDMFYNMVVV